MLAHNLTPPAGWERRITLRSGGEALVRPIRADDAPRLIEGFTHLSAQSIYYRFFIKRKELGLEEAIHLAEVDYHERMAFVAELPPYEDHDDLIGVIRYEPFPDQPHAVEMAIVVGDEYQHRGVGLPLFHALVDYAIAQNYTTMIADVLNDNYRMFHFLERSGYPLERHPQGIMTRFVIAIAPATS
jgi:RimJ/RimL family protein N-acetyltransferase